MNRSVFLDHIDKHTQTVNACRGLTDVIELAGHLLIEVLKQGGRLYAFGNGGSSAQASHLAAELMGRFKKNRKGLPAFSLGSDTGVVTCVGNDFGYDELFARQVHAAVNATDVVVGLTTSGRSENVIGALEEGSQIGAKTIALTGKGGLSRGGVNYIVKIPSDSTAIVQEVHLIIIHVWCMMIDEQFH